MGVSFLKGPPQKTQLVFLMVPSKTIEHLSLGPQVLASSADSPA